MDKPLSKLRLPRNAPPALDVRAQLPDLEARVKKLEEQVLLLSEALRDLAP